MMENNDQLTHSCECTAMEDVESIGMVLFNVKLEGDGSRAGHRCNSKLQRQVSKQTFEDDTLRCCNTTSTRGQERAIAS